MLTEVTAGRGKVRPALRVAALLAGLGGLPGGVILSALGFPDWKMVVQGVGILATSAFFIFVGATGRNFDNKAR